MHRNFRTLRHKTAYVVGRSYLIESIVWRDIVFKSRLGWMLGAGALVLLLSPEARKAARRWAVKGTEIALDLTDMTKDAGTAAQSKLQALTSRSEKIFSSNANRQH